MTTFDADRIAFADRDQPVRPPTATEEIRSHLLQLVEQLTERLGGARDQYRFAKEQLEHTETQRDRILLLVDVIDKSIAEEQMQAAAKASEVGEGTTEAHRGGMLAGAAEPSFRRGAL